MKIDQKKGAVILCGTLISLVICIVGISIKKAQEPVISTTLKQSEFYNQSFEKITNTTKDVNSKLDEEIRKKSVVFDGLTLEELAQKLEKSMNSTLNGKGELFATYSIELGLDPYLALAIVLHETGCSYRCSGLVQSHYNLGGLKGGNGSYLYFKSIDDGIKGYLNILYKNYYSKGLTTPELMNPKYAASKTWASRVNWYINQIKAK